MCAVFDCLVVCTFVLCIFRTTLDNLETTYFKSSKRGAVFLHFTSTHNCPTLFFRPNFSTVTLVQFCVSKALPFNITTLIEVQLACNNNEVVKVCMQSFNKIHFAPKCCHSVCICCKMYPLIIH